MTKQLAALLAATFLSLVAFAGPAAAADPEPADTEQEEPSEERLGESSTTEEAEPEEEKKKDEKKEDEADSWLSDFVSKTSWAPGAVYSMAQVAWASGGFYDPNGDIPIDEPDQDQEGKRSSEHQFPGADIVLAAR